MFSTTQECHTTRERLADYVLGALPKDEAAAIRTHLATCADCQDEHYCLAAVSAHLTPLKEALAHDSHRRVLGRRHQVRATRLTLAQWVRSNTWAAAS
ncbi:zf-HC2 domain-containing protein [Streptomyces sp. NPDC046821]|uniref:anti-sigma factor family protein n=1 Tax=Streptomyces sp. NPDC046821 TaxID=3154702 RepID=UPI003409BD6A